MRQQDVDQLFGVILALILRKHDFEEPAELMDYVKTSLSERFRLKGEMLIVEQLSAVRDFGAWLEPTAITLYNAFSTRQGIESPHAFIFKQRCDLTSSDKQWLATEPGLLDGDLKDVFCCVKTYMRDLDLQQAPVLVLPARAMARVVVAPATILPLHEMKPKVIEQYMSLAEVCDAELGLQRAAAALRALVSERLYSLPRDEWLAAVAAPRPDARGGGHAYFPYLPAQSWQLMVRHHRT